MRSIVSRIAGAVMAAGLSAAAACPGLPAPHPNCDAVPTNVEGEPVFDPGEDTTSVDASGFVGHVHTLHPTYDTSDDAWYAAWVDADDACPSLGGEMPSDDPGDIPGVPDETVLAAQLDSVETLLSALPPAPPPPQLPDLPALADSLCGSGKVCAPQPHVPGPFAGADIVYVHGFRPEPMKEEMAGLPTYRWPDDPAEFVGGGKMRVQAQAYWQAHVQEMLVGRGAKNRVLFVAWSPLQPMEIAAHALLMQVGMAMGYGDGVVLMDPADPRGTADFCIPDCVYVTHGAGAPVTDVAMAWAANTNLVPPVIRPPFTKGGYIPAHARVHVALGGTFSGTQYATAAMASSLVPGMSSSMCPLARILVELSGNDPCPDDTIVFNSILRDLTPISMQTRWYPILAETPVNVLTIAGGHDSHNFPYKRYFARGFDDGLVAMESACGRRNPFFSWPAGYQPKNWWRIYDRGVGGTRALRYLGEQRYEPQLSGPTSRASAACTPWKSPTGMVQPLFNATSLPTEDPIAYIPNHFAFVQTAERHIEGLRDCRDRQAEDVRANLGTAVYLWVSSGMANLQVEEVVGRQTKKKRWIWKRVYHRLDGWRTRCAADYAYDYVK